MTKQRHCFVTDVGNAIEALASALDPQREPPFKGDILDLLEWAEKDVLEMRSEIEFLRQLVTLLRDALDSANHIITFEGVPYYLLGIEERDEILAATKPKPLDDSGITAEVFRPENWK